MMIADPERLVLRGRFGLITTGFVAALAAWMLIDAAAHGAWLLILRATPWIAAILALCWAVLVRPCVEVLPTGLRVVNLARTHLVPWVEIAELRVKYQLVVERFDGSELKAWGSPTVERQRVPDTFGSGAKSSKLPFVGIVSIIEDARDAMTIVPAAGSTAIAWKPAAAIASLVVVAILVGNWLG